jgi:hypothetical protein
MAQTMKLTEIFQLICYYVAALIDVNLTLSEALTA